MSWVISRPDPNSTTKVRPRTWHKRYLGTKLSASRTICGKKIGSHWSTDYTELPSLEAIEKLGLTQVHMCKRCAQYDTRKTT